MTPYEIAFGEPDTQDETAAKKFDFKKRWPIAAAAVALLAIAGAGIPAVRHFGGAGAAAPTADGTLTVNTNPPGAKVFVDGVERGMTPLTVALKPGTHALELRGDGTPRLMPITDDRRRCSSRSTSSCRRPPPRSDSCRCAPNLPARASASTACRAARRRSRSAT